MTDYSTAIASKEDNIEHISLICECYTEIMNVSTFKIDIASPTSFKEEELFNFAIYTYGHFKAKPSFWTRLKYAYWHITTGKTYLDEITLSKKETFKLLTFLNKFYEKV